MNKSLDEFKILFIFNNEIDKMPRSLNMTNLSILIKCNRER